MEHPLRPVTTFVQSALPAARTSGPDCLGVAQGFVLFAALIGLIIGD